LRQIRLNPDEPLRTPIRPESSRPHRAASSDSRRPACRDRGQDPLLRLPAVGDNAAMEAEPSKAEPPKRKRRCVQFSMRSLMVFVVVVAIPCAWIARRIESKRREREVVQALVRLGATEICYDYEMADPAHPPGPEWARRWLGDDFFSDVVKVELPFGELDDDDWSLFRELPHLRELHLGQSNINDARLKCLGGLSQLQKLTVYSEAITDAGLIHLRGLTQIQELDLSDTKIGDEGLAIVKEMPQLRKLWLGGTQVSDAGLANLELLTRLERLELYRTKIDDAGLDHIRGLTQLQVVNLAGTRVTDRALVVLKRLTRLEDVCLGTNATESGVKELKAALPNASVYRELHGVLLPYGFDD
jgi:internalin A